MQTSGFQPGFVAVLAASLGFSLASWDAVGYSSGPSVSLGSNPLWSLSGTLASCSTDDLLTVPAGQVAVVTGFRMNDSDLKRLFQDGAIGLDFVSNGVICFTRLKARCPCREGQRFRFATFVVVEVSTTILKTISYRNRAIYS